MWGRRSVRPWPRRGPRRHGEHRLCSALVRRWGDGGVAGEVGGGGGRRGRCGRCRGRRSWLRGGRTCGRRWRRAVRSLAAYALDFDDPLGGGGEGRRGGRAMGVVPAWLDWPVKVSSKRDWPTMAWTTSKLGCLRIDGFARTRGRGLARCGLRGRRRCWGRARQVWGMLPGFKPKLRMAWATVMPSASVRARWSSVSWPVAARELRKGKPKRAPSSSAKAMSSMWKGSGGGVEFFYCGEGEEDAEGTVEGAGVGDGVDCGRRGGGWGAFGMWLGRTARRLPASSVRVVRPAWRIHQVRRVWASRVAGGEEEARWFRRGCR